MLIALDLSSALPLASFAGMVLGMLMAFLSLFLILLILVQRGRGGGLSGALGGPGGQSAFGSKAGDTFTVVTVGVAGVWILVCAFAMWLLGMHAPAVADRNDGSDISAGPTDGDVEDIASGLVVPTMDEEKENDSDVELTPAEGTEAEMKEADPASEEPKTEEPKADAPKPEEAATEKTPE
ncbi:preprotein translocase subunit SecG [Neorhodopirellula pilleata]|uniref:Protein-export membrane protein SecG n=1 Tax=Neorhodopirellula pilleata TaxID=2714738 RepID=A0A5C6AAW8_9BACT|nr:preprotein translocase subunit SecG [Neorhodopirellula pilleata]TWT96507.1 preprotein translocase subunit SecG [Neorhodopirellula pilleata]